MTSQKSGSLLLENPFCLYPGELFGSPSPTPALGDDGIYIVIPQFSGGNSRHVDLSFISKAQKQALDSDM